MDNYNIDYAENNYNRDDLVFCPMCDENHENNSMCQFMENE